MGFKSIVVGLRFGGIGGTGLEMRSSVLGGFEAGIVVNGWSWAYGNV